jgi:cytoskeletal protein RodZ
MSDPSFDFPQDELPNEETPKKAKQMRKSTPPRGKSILGKFLFFILIIALISAGFVFVQKTLLDIEAQAQIAAVQTISAPAASESKKTTPVPPTLPSSPFTQSAPTQEPTSTPLPPTLTATPNPDLVHTATVAAQLTLAAN